MLSLPCHSPGSNDSDSANMNWESYSRHPHARSQTTPIAPPLHHQLLNTFVYAPAISTAHPSHAEQTRTVPATPVLHNGHLATGGTFLSLIPIFPQHAYPHASAHPGTTRRPTYRTHNQMMTRGKQAVRWLSVADDAAALPEAGLDRADCERGVGDHAVVLGPKCFFVVRRTAAEEL